MTSVKQKFLSICSMILKKSTKEEEGELSLGLTYRHLLLQRRGKRLSFCGSSTNFLRNGRLVLEESISFFHGKSNPVCCFSIEELNTMVLDCDFFVFADGFSKWYRGVWEGRPVMVRSHDRIEEYGCGIECVIREIVVATQMGTHQNVQKLLGCCLETNLPVLVYEWVGTETLADRLLGDENQKKPPLEWRDRLRIAWEISHAIAYLHLASPRPIIHKDLKPATVFLDQDNTAKVFDFSLSVSIPEGEEYVQPDKLIGCFAYLAPEYRMEGRVAESADVYAFGVLFLVLLTGKAALYSPRGEGDTNIFLVDWVREGWRRKSVSEIVDPLIIARKVTYSELLHQQLGASIQLALRCIAEDEDRRPTMVEVGTDIQNMMRSIETFP